MPGRKRKNEDSEDLLTELKESVDSKETTKVTSTETEQVMTDSDEGIKITTGLSPIKRTRNGAGRKREDNPFDEFIEQFYQAEDPAGVEFSSEEQKTSYINQIKNAVKHHNDENDTSYGVEFGVDRDMPNVLKFNIRDKVSGRGRKPGSKKVDGHFYSPDELDSDGNPTAEARAAKENPSASATDKVDA